MGWLAKFRVCLIVTAAFILITLAVAFSVLRAVLPHATGYLAEINQALEQQLALPVKIDSMDAGMHWLQPQLKLLNVRVYNADGKTVLVAFDEVTFTLSYIDTLRYMTPMIGDISLSGADLSVDRDRRGRWFLQGVQIVMGDSEQISDELVNQINSTNFSLLNSTLHLRDATHALNNMDFANVNIRVENLLGTHAVQASVGLPEIYGQSLQLVADINGDLSKLEAASAEIYLNARSLEIKPVFDELGLKDTITAKGIASAEVWLTVENRRIKQVKTRAELGQLSVQSADRKQHWEADSVAANVFWQGYSDAWRLDVNDLNISRNGVAWEHPGEFLLRDNAAAGYQISATYFRLVDLGGLIPILLGKHYPEEIRRALALDLQGDIYNLNLVMPPEDKSGGSVTRPELRVVFRNLGFRLAEDKLSLTGLDGQLEYKDDEAKLVLASNDLRAEMASLFAEPLELQSLDTILVINREKQDWMITAESIRMSNTDIATRSRLYALWPENGKLYLDMQTDFRDALVDSAAKYYPVGIMSQGLVSWLESSLSGGRVNSGSFVFRGQPADFPFADNQGVMEVQFDTSDVGLKFLPDWPALENTAARVRFYNESLQIENFAARVYRGDIHDASVMVDDLHNVTLNITGKVSAPADDVQHYIWNSGLNSVLGDAMRQLQLLGNIDIDLALAVPLDQKDATIETSGTVKFADNQLQLPAMNYLLTDLNGELGFTRESITADKLSARFEDAEIDISARTETSPEKESVFQVRGRLPIDGLLKRFRWLPDDWLRGRSDWDISVHLPLGSGRLPWFSLASSLQGTSLSISDRFSKPADDSLPTRLTVKLLADSLQLEAVSPGVLDVHATRDAHQHWLLDIAAPWLSGKVDFDEGMAIDSVIDMKFAYVDLFSLAKSGQQGGAGPGLAPATIPELRFHADKLDWDAWHFTDVDMNSSHQNHGLQIENLVAHGRALNITGTGSWLSDWQSPNETSLKLKVKSQHLGDTLAGLGHAGTFDHGELEADIDWHWAAEPYRFALDALNGEASFKLEKGVMLEVTPGAGGRLLGLFNVLQLPRRFLGDFGDVYKEGFVFDTITGDLAFAGGNVTTRNVKIEATSASISVDGRVGLVSEDYDLNMVVKPASSAGLFTGGTIAGGPVLGAGLVLLEKLFGIDKLAQETYSITGNWNKPVIERMDKIETREKPGEKEQS